ncbi:MAG: hypothetical protein EBU90_31280 [Proteobacteria bacterium]|jgi:hypothetical protein|nr:hypothetical protein [Pseudomonadota bacterium]NBP15903.1 hypothetical protein [bacterium]
MKKSYSLLITFLLIFFMAHSQNRKDSLLKRLFCCWLKQKEKGNVSEDTKSFKPISPIEVFAPARNSAEEKPIPLLNQAIDNATIDWELAEAIEHSLDSVKCDLVKPSGE